jgi:hypothetical protein
MKVFISWSGDRSKSIARALKVWLTDVFSDVQPWMSDHDINAGSRWGTELNRELKVIHFGILCLTPENLKSSWLLFEAGSLAKALEEARVVPYLYNLTAADVGFPLAQFQGVNADEEGTRKLLQSLNSARESTFTSEKLERTFKKWWPDLQSQLEKIPSINSGSEPQRSDRSLIEEILQFARMRVEDSGMYRLDKELEHIHAHLDHSVSSIREELRYAFSLHNLPIMWTKSETVYQVQKADLAAMNASTIKSYLDQVQELYNKTKDSKLLEKVEMVKAELRNRSLDDV